MNTFEQSGSFVCVFTEDAPEFSPTVSLHSDIKIVYDSDDDVPEGFDEAVADLEAGRVVDIDVAHSEKPPE